MRQVWKEGDLEIAVALEIEELASMRGQWDRLAFHPAIDPDSYMTRLQQDPDVIGPVLMSATRSGTLVGLFVGRLESKRLDYRVGYLSVCRPKARVLAGLDRGLIGGEDPVVAAGFVNSIMGLLQEGIVDFVHLPSVDINSPIRGLAQQIPPRLCRSSVAGIEPRWFLSIPETFDEFLATRSRNTRSNIRRHEKALLREHPQVRVTVLGRKAPDALAAFGDVMKVFERTYQHSLGLSPLCHPYARQAWEEACVLGSLALTLVYIDDRPVAFSVAHILKSTALFATPGYDPRYGSVHVGEYSLLRLIEALIADGGVTTLDYGLGYAQYKESFGTGSTLEGHVRIFAPSVRGVCLNLTRTATSTASSWLAAATDMVGLKNGLKQMYRSYSNR